MLTRALGEAERAARIAGEVVDLPSGLRLKAVLLETRDAAEDAPATPVVAAVRIVAVHESLFPDGLPEVLHAAGTTVDDAVVSACAAWAARTLPVLEDAVAPAVRDCDLMNIKILAGNIPAGMVAGPGAGEERVYQAVCGQVVCAVELPARSPEEAEPCSFCMTTRIQDALAGRLRGDGYTGIRLMAGRDGDGYLVADCQLNGEPLPEAAARLMAYAQSWPPRGFEVREQYVILRPLTAA